MTWRVMLVLLAVLTLAPAPGMAQNPPDAWHPFRGGVNCVQVADTDGNFNCSPLVTIDPSTGVLTIALGNGPVTSVLGPLVIGHTPSLFRALGNDIVIDVADSFAVAPAGPGAGGLTLRVRPSPTIPGACRVVAIAGGAFGNAMEFPMAFLNPAYAFLSTKIGSGQALYDYYTVDLPGGPGGC